MREREQEQHDEVDQQEKELTSQSRLDSVLPLGAHRFWAETSMLVQNEKLGTEAKLSTLRSRVRPGGHGKVIPFLPPGRKAIIRHAVLFRVMICWYTHYTNNPT